MTLQTLHLSAANPDELLSSAVLGAGALIRIERSASGGGAGFSEIATVPLVAATYAYTCYDSGGSATAWYRTRYSNAGGTVTTDYTAEFQASSYTLYDLRQRLNADLSVKNDAETSPWSQTYRNDAIAQGYAALWTHGVWNPVTEDVATSSTSQSQVVSGVQVLERAALFDSGVLIEDVPAATLRQEGTEYRVTMPLMEDGYTVRLYGYYPYKCVFSGDYDTDDLPRQWTYLPLLWAAAVCYGQQRARFVRYGSRQTVPPEMNATGELMLALEAAAVRKFEIECKALAQLRPRVGKRIAGWRGV